MKESVKEKLEKLKIKKQLLQFRIQRMESSHKTLEKKKDTRRKILVGSYYLDKATKENKLEALNKLLDTFLTRDSDRQLFNLPFKENKKEISND